MSTTVRGRCNCGCRIVLAFLIVIAVSIVLGLIGAALGDGGRVVLQAIGNVLTAPIAALVASILFFDLGGGQGVQTPRLSRSRRSHRRRRRRRPSRASPRTQSPLGVQSSPRTSASRPSSSVRVSISSWLSTAVSRRSISPMWWGAAFISFATP